MECTDVHWEEVLSCVVGPEKPWSDGRNLYICSYTTLTCLAGSRTLRSTLLDTSLVQSPVNHRSRLPLQQLWLLTSPSRVNAACEDLPVPWLKRGAIDHVRTTSLFRPRRQEIWVSQTYSRFAGEEACAKWQRSIQQSKR